MVDSALVLGAGGITGIAWELGLLIGLRDAGVDLTTADLIVGTSAGSVAGSLIASGVDLVAGARFEAARGADEPPIRPDWARGAEAFALLNDESRDPVEIRAAVGALALAAEVGAEEPYVASLARRLPVQDWPDRPLIITAVEATTGEPVAWDRTSGVPLSRAVAASCAVPCVFPTVGVNGGRYMDGGVRSLTNADLAADAARVVVLSPLASIRMRSSADAEIGALRRTAAAILIAPDEAALAAIGDNVLNPARWAPAVAAGTAQAGQFAAAVAEVWAS